MAITVTIRCKDRAPLGDVEEVTRRLSEAFPGVWFRYQAKESPELAAVQMSLILRLWLSVFGDRTQYPNCVGGFEGGQGGAVEFYFKAEEPVRWVRATSYGRTTSLTANFDRLCAATGWVIKYPRF
jgi:hypothetical protein